MRGMRGYFKEGLFIIESSIERWNKVGTYCKTEEYSEYHKLLTLMFSYCPIKHVGFYFESKLCDGILNQQKLKAEFRRKQESLLLATWRLQLDFIILSEWSFSREKVITGNKTIVTWYCHINKMKFLKRKN